MSELTGRELDAAVAGEVMGGAWLYWPERHQRKLVFDALSWNRQEYKSGDVLAELDNLEDVPRYSTSLNACAQAEARVVEMGLGEVYANELMTRVAPDWTGGHDLTTRHLLALATASTGARCQAMLTVAREATAQEVR